MTETIQMFDSKGHFVYPPDSAIAALSDLEKIRFECIRLAYEDCAAVAKSEAEAIKKVEDDLVALNEIERHIAKFPKPTFHDLWKQSFGKNSGSKHPGKN